MLDNRSDKSALDASNNPKDIFTSAFMGLEDPIDRARTDFCYYLEHAVRDETTGEYIVLDKHHYAFINGVLLNDEVRFGIVEFPRGAGKSTILNAYCAWEGSRNPSLRFIISSKTDDQSEIQMRGIEKQLRTPEHIKVFGNMIPDQKARNTLGYVWNSQEKALRGTQTEMNRDPTFTAVGTGSELVAGRRSNIIIGDDLIAEKASYSDAYSEHIKDWFNRTLLPTRDPRNSKVIIIGTPFAKGDLYDSIHEAQKNAPTYKRLSVPAFKVDNRGVRVMDTKTGLPISYWPEMWPVKELLAREEENWWAFASQYMLERVDPTKAQFKREWLQFVEAKDLPPLSQLTVYQGIDPAGMKGDKLGDFLTLATVGVDHTGQGFLLDLMATRGDKEETVTQIVNEILRYQPKMISVEIDGGQQHFKAWLEEQLRGRIRGRTVELNPVSSRNIPKAIRLMDMSDYFRRGDILLSGMIDRDDGDLSPIPNLESFVDQWIMFPTGSHDDSLDAVNIAITPVYVYAPISDVVRRSDLPREEREVIDSEIVEGMVEIVGKDVESSIIVTHEELELIKRRRRVRRHHEAEMAGQNSTAGEERREMRSPSWVNDIDAPRRGFMATGRR